MRLKEIEFLKQVLPLVYVVPSYVINFINRHMFVMAVLLEMDVEEKNIITTQMMHKHHTMTEKVILEKDLI